MIKSLVERATAWEHYEPKLMRPQFSKGSTYKCFSFFLKKKRKIIEKFWLHLFTVATSVVRLIFMGALYQLTSFTGFYKVMVTFLSPNQSHVYQRLSSKVHIHVYIVNPFKKQFVVFLHNKLSHISTLSTGFFFFRG